MQENNQATNPYGWAYWIRVANANLEIARDAIAERMDEANPFTDFIEIEYLKKSRKAVSDAMQAINPVKDVRP